MITISGYTSITIPAVDAQESASPTQLTERECKIWKEKQKLNKSLLIHCPKVTNSQSFEIGQEAVFGFFLNEGNKYYSIYFPAIFMGQVKWYKFVPSNDGILTLQEA